MVYNRELCREGSDACCRTFRAMSRSAEWIGARPSPAMKIGKRTCDCYGRIAREKGVIHDRFLSRANENLSVGNGGSPSLGDKNPPSAIMAEFPNRRRSLGATNVSRSSSLEKVSHRSTPRCVTWHGTSGNKHRSLRGIARDCTPIHWKNRADQADPS